MTNPPSSANDPLAKPDAAPHRAGLVKLAVVCTALIFLACVAVLVYRGLTIEVPDSVLIVRASPAWDGTTISVDGVRMARPSEVLVEPHTKYTISFHLVPGDYTLAATREGKTLLTQPVLLTRRSRSEVVYLPGSLEGLAPATQPGSPFRFEVPWFSAPPATPDD